MPQQVRGVVGAPPAAPETGAIQRVAFFIANIV